MRKVYMGHVHSLLDYAGASWQPWLQPSNIRQLENIANRALRMVTGQASATRLEALRLEAGVQSFDATIRQNSIRSREKTLRLPADHPRNLALTSTVRRRLPKRRDARSVAESLSQQIPNIDIEPRVPLTYFTLPPWAKGIGATQVFPTLPRITLKNADQEDIRQATIRRDKCRHKHLYGCIGNGRHNQRRSGGGGHQRQS